jgi:thiol-disulfide isomerase/thioredoxin
VLDPTSRRRARALALGLVELASISASCDGSDASRAAAPPAASSPSVEVVDLAGLEAALAERRGRGVLLNFWALWCAPCVEELAELLEVGEELADRGGVVVLVSYDLIVPNATVDQARRDVVAFAERLEISAPISIYDAPDYEAINARFDLPGGVPVTLAIDRAGKVVATHDGQASKDEFRALMVEAQGL